MNSIFLVGIFLTSSAGHSQSRDLIDTLSVSAQDTLYGALTYLSMDREPGVWHYSLKKTAPEGYYLVFWEAEDESYLYREGLFSQGYQKGAWIEYHANGQVVCVETWNRKMSIGKRALYNKEGKPIRTCRWVFGVLIMNKEYKNR